MFTNIKRLTRMQMDCENMAYSVTTKRNSARPRCFGHKDRHTSQHSLESSLERLNFNLHHWVFPKQNMMLEINRDVSQFEMQNGNQLTFDVVANASERFVSYTCG